ncbi:MAG: transporter substrate-binding domain-containing protein [Oscillospiraceae bacterium]|jgi:ABC-type amino acid transport substrate-binding protein|nr:transporter substrate-binding domain-containing protein [Oscillospiraceae bacterium]
MFFRKRKFKTAISTALLTATVFTLASCGAANPTVFTVDDVRGKTIGGVAFTVGGYYNGTFGKPESYATAKELALAITAGTVDCGFADSRLAKSITRQGSSLYIVKEPFFDIQLRICVAQEMSDMLRDLQAALSSCIAAGNVADLEDKYINGKGNGISPPDLSGTENFLTLAVIEGGFYPYGYPDENAPLGYAGIDVELAQFICRRLNLGLNIIEVPRARLLDCVKFGQADFSMGGIYSGEAGSDEVLLSSPYGNLTLSVITRR